MQKTQQNDDLCHICWHLEKGLRKEGIELEVEIKQFWDLKLDQQ